MKPRIVGVEPPILSIEPFRVAANSDTDDADESDTCGNEAPGGISNPLILYSSEPPYKYMSPPLSIRLYP